jgi:Tfp pilus assembly protein PilV
VRAVGYVAILIISVAILGILGTCTKLNEQDMNKIVTHAYQWYILKTRFNLHLICPLENVRSR